jgi:hypothetical protein
MSANATGTPTPNFSIPKFNTASDAPNGTGVNEMMDSIDTALDGVRDASLAVVGSPSNRDGLVYDTATSTWKPSSAHKMGVTGLEAGTNGQVLTTTGGVPAWGTSASIGYGTALPGSPVDGDHFILTDSLTAPTYQWFLRYVAAKASNKWISLGSAPLAVAAGGQASSNTAYSGPFGPSITIPVTGIYAITIGGHVVLTGGAGLAHASYSVGGTAANDVWGVGVYFGSASAMASRTYFHGQIAGGTVLNTYVRAPNAASYGTWSEIALSIVPRAIGG